MILGKIKDDDSREFLGQVEFVSWCDKNYLNLNVKKTKEMVIDFRRRSVDCDRVMINAEHVERVHDYKYLGIIIDDKMSGSANTTSVQQICTTGSLFQNHEKH